MWCNMSGSSGLVALRCGRVVNICFCVSNREGDGLTSAHVLWFLRVPPIISIPTATEGGGFDGGATVEWTLLA